MVTPRATHAAFPGANGRIVFSSDRIDAGYYDIWSMAADGSDPQQLTTAPLIDIDATWSPGGAFIAFTRYNSANYDDGEIWIMNADGSGEKKLTNTVADDFSPAFSPDGAKIWFASDRDGDYDIYSMNLDGSGVTNWTNDTGVDDITPALDSNGRIFWARAVGTGSFDLVYRPINKSSARQTLVATAANELYPNLYPSGLLGGTTFPVLYSDATNNVIRSISTAGGASSFQEYGYSAAWAAAGAGQFVFDALGTESLGDIFIHDTGGTTNLTGAVSNSDDTDPDWQPIPAFPLVDAQFSTYNADIVWVYEQGITSGCSAERYCPNDNVTRAQMASFLARAMGLPAATQDYFSDDNGTTHEANINKIAEAGITTGCAAGLYCPNDNVSRAQMASFLARALNLPPTATDYFTDDDGNIHEININKLAASGITSGCGGTLYCPSLKVTRGQMAAFLHRGFGP
jgi:hypothetical protein